MDDTGFQTWYAHTLHCLREGLPGAIAIYKAAAATRKALMIELEAISDSVLELQDQFDFFPADADVSKLEDALSELEQFVKLAKGAIHKNRWIYDTTPVT